MIKAMSVNGGECERVFPLMKNAGFDAVDIGLDGVDLGNADDRVWKKRIEEIGLLLEKNGLACAQAHLPFYDMFLSSEIPIEKNERAIKNAFCAMAALGAEWGAYHPRSSTGFDYGSHPMNKSGFAYEREKALHDNREAIKGYLEYASKYGVGIAIENIPVFPDCPQYKFFSANPDDHLELADSLGSESVGVCWDFGHANLMDYDVCEVLKKFGKRIKILHVHNNYGDGDMHIAPSIGSVEWNGVMSTLKQIGYSGPLALEVNIHRLAEEYWERYIRYCGEDAKCLENKFEK